MATGVLDWSGGMMAGQALGGIFPALVNISSSIFRWEYEKISGLDGMATGVLDWSGGMMAGQALGGIFPALVNILVISLQVRICWVSVADPDPSDPYVFGPPGSGSISQRYRYGSGSFYNQAKIVRKTEIPTVLWLLFNFLSLKNDINVPSKSNKLKKLAFCLHFEGRWRKQQDPDPHPDP